MYNLKVIILGLISLAFIYAAKVPTPPELSELQAVSSNERIFLMWNNNAENSIDSLTGYSDFEGYRIYRSKNGGLTWGEEGDRIYDYSGNHVGWKPYSQYDLIENSDSLHCNYKNGYLGESGELCDSEGSTSIRTINIIGYDPMASWINLGDNDSLKLTFVDTDVLDGVEYTYAVTAYDMGMISFNIDYISTDPNGLVDNYCNGDDSYCDGSYQYCDDDDSYCDCTNGTTLCSDNAASLTAGTCALPGFEGTWVIVEYTSQELCEFEGYGWSTDEIISEETCVMEGYNWIDVEYFDEDSCEEDKNEDGSPDHEWQIIHFSPDTTWSSNNPGHFPGLEYSNDLWGYPSFESPKLYELFTDYNTNGICDNEPFTDKDASDNNQNGICDEAGDWTSRCSTDVDECINVAVVQSGYKASNITFPEDTPEVEFIIPDSDNVGNGARSYNIVNEYDLTDAVLRFEINAGLDPNSFGDSTGSFATLEPGLYCYEAISANNLNPKDTYDLSIIDIDSDSLDFILGLPGVHDYSGYCSNENYTTQEMCEEDKPCVCSDENFSEESTCEGAGHEWKCDSDIWMPEQEEYGTFISIPNYQLDDFKLTYVDNPLYESNYTDWFDGIQFRFDNGPNTFNGNPLALVELKKITFSDDLLKELVHIKMRYKNQNDLTKRPSFTYLIKFSTSIIDTAVYGTGRDCDQYGVNYPPNSHTLLPFRITNITTDKKVNLEHKDSGVDYGSIEFGELSGSGCNPVCGTDYVCINGTCITKKGSDNCQWEYNEFVTLKETVYTSNAPNGADDKLFDLKIGFNWGAYARSHVPDYFGEVFNTIGWDWEEYYSYDHLSVVYHEGMLYRATEDISVTNPPDEWFDDDDDGVNNNPWQMLYPWQEGDSLIVEPYGWYQDGDAWVADLSVIGALDGYSKDDLDSIKVVPNPYIVNSNYFNESPGNHLMRFTRLPDECSISIYTITGEFVNSISHNDPFDGNEWWNLKNGHNQEVAPGLYIYVVEAGKNKKIGKFAIIR